MFKLIIHSLMLNNVYSQMGVLPLVGGSRDDNDCLMMSNNQRFWKIKKSKYLIFRKLTQNEILRLTFENFSFN